APQYTMAAVIANEFTEAADDLYLHALVEIGFVLFMITIIINTLLRLLIWSVEYRKPAAKPAAPPVPAAAAAQAMKRGNYFRRKLLSAGVVGFCGASVVLALIPLALVLFFVVGQGATSLNWDFFTKLPKPVGETGGSMSNAIVGTLMLIAMGSGIAVPLGILCGVYLSEYGPNRLAAGARFAADVLTGVPSIVVGIFAYALAVLPVRHFSALAGSIALAVMMVPIVARTTEEMLRLVP